MEIGPAVLVHGRRSGRSSEQILQFGWSATVVGRDGVQRGGRNSGVARLAAAFFPA